MVNNLFRHSLLEKQPLQSVGAAAGRLLAEWQGGSPGADEVGVVGAVAIVGSLGRETAHGEVSGLSCPESWLLPGAAGTTSPQDWWVTLEMEIVASNGIYFTSAFSLGTLSFFK